MEKKVHNNDLELIDIDKDKQDPDIKPIEEINNDMGSILIDDYTDIEPLHNDEIDEETLQEDINTNSDSLKINYSFNGQDVVEGLTSIQTTLMFKKNMVYTVCLLILFFVYMLDFANFQSMILGLVSLCVIAVIWLMPKFHIKRFAQIADEKKLKLSMELFPSYIKVIKENDSLNLSYKKQIDNIIETQNLFVVCAGKSRVFIVPKRCVDESLHEFIREIFQEAVGDKFHQKSLII